MKLFYCIFLWLYNKFNKKRGSTDKKIKAFTLAETPITLMVIGVVAALTIPALMQQIGDYTLQRQ